jgi:DNA-binding LacI/PurR family transcriptional regulator
VSAEDKPARVANIFDVARLAGVSHQTVSRVLNNLPNVRPATRERVEQAIAQLRYSPSPAARALVTRRTRTIGLVTPGVSDFGPTSIAMHFNLAARTARYSVETVTALDSDATGIRWTIEALLRQRVDAIVLIVVDAAVLEFIRTLELTIPLVAVAAGPRRGPHVVSIDQYRGARSAVRHLAELGYTRIHHLAGPATAPDAIERVRGWRDELVAQRLEAPELLQGDWTARSGYELGHEIELGPATAAFTSNDQMAIGLLAAMRERETSVPEGLSVVGFDDIPEAGYLSPPLTTVRQDFAALGALMMQKVLVAVEEPDSATEDTPLPTRLVVRGSTRSLAD